MMEDPTQAHHNGSPWTLASLREYLLRVVADLATRQTQLAEAQDKAVQAALVAQEKAVQAALAAADKAVTKAEEGASDWRKSANEWRGAMSDRERDFISRNEYNQAMKALEDKVDASTKATLDKVSLIQEWITHTKGSQVGHAETWALVVSAVMALIGIGGFIATIFHTAPK